MNDAYSQKLDIVGPSEWLNQTNIVSGETMITLPPLPEGVVGRSIYRSRFVPVYPWWAPLWIRNILPWSIERHIPKQVRQIYIEIGSVEA